MNHLYKLRVLAGSLAMMPVVVLAQGDFPEFGPGKLESPLRTGGQVIEVLKAIVIWFGIIVGVISVLVFLYAAFLFLISGGSDRMAQAKQWLTWGIVGVVVALFAAVIVPIIIDFLAGALF
jgi:hypothetical protein